MIIMDLIGIFMGNPTAGQRNGVEVSTDGLMTAPVEASIDRSSSTVITCAVRCESGCTCDSAVLSAVDENDNAAGWLTLSNDNNTFSNSITITNIGDTNKLFYARIQSGSTVGVKTAAIKVVGTVEVS